MSGDYVPDDEVTSEMKLAGAEALQASLPFGATSYEFLAGEIYKAMRSAAKLSSQRDQSFCEMDSGRDQAAHK